MSMTQLDNEIVVCYNDEEIISETEINGSDQPNSTKSPHYEESDLSPHRRRIEYESEWFDPKAFFNERKQSLSNKPPSSLPPLNFKSKQSVIGLPHRPDSCPISPGFRRPPPNVRFFPKPSAGPPLPILDPGSPEVSCIGTVSPRLRRSSSGEPSSPSSPRLWSRVLTALRHSRKQAAQLPEPPSQALDVEKNDTCQMRPAPSLGEMKKVRSGRRQQSNREPSQALDVEKNDTCQTPTPLPRLGEMKRLRSGRRELDEEMDVGVDVASPDSMNKDTVRSPRLWARQLPWKCIRDRGSVGPAST